MAARVAINGRLSRSGVALRMPVPVPAGSLADIGCVTSRETTDAEVNDVFRQAAAGDRYHGVLGVADEPLVSGDIVAAPRACAVDLARTPVPGGDLLEVMAWYDNGWGYARQMVRRALAMAGATAAAQR